MLAKGNGDIMTCVTNLLRCVRGEVPYSRAKGMNPDLIDQPATTAVNQLMSDAQWQIEHYEPRVDVSDINIMQALARTGDFNLNIGITEVDE